MNSDGDSFDRYLAGLQQLQSESRIPKADVKRESPEAALASLQEAVDAAPADFRSYLEEALACYEGRQYRAAILMVWSATIEHLRGRVTSHRGGLKALEAANSKRFGASKNYRPIKKQGDLEYVKDADFIQLYEDAGACTPTARKLLKERLDLRNRCGHPTGYTPGRGEVVVFVESLLLNIIGGNLLNW